MILLFVRVCSSALAVLKSDKSQDQWPLLRHFSSAAYNFPPFKCCFPLAASILIFCFWIFTASLCSSITCVVLGWHLGWWIFGIPPLPCFWRSLYSAFYLFLFIYFFTIIQLGFLCFHTAFLTVLFLQIFQLSQTEQWAASRHSSYPQKCTGWVCLYDCL